MLLTKNKKSFFMICLIFLQHVSFFTIKVQYQNEPLASFFDLTDFESIYGLILLFFQILFFQIFINSKISKKLFTFSY